MIVKKIEFYTVLYSPRMDVRQVWLRAGNEYIGQVIFWPDDGDLPDSTAEVLHYHERDYANLIDLLRNEQPVFLMSSELDDTTVAAIMTGTEMVGDGEIREMLSRGT